MATRTETRKIMARPTGRGESVLPDTIVLPNGYVLPIGNVADGEYLRRNGSQFVGDTAAAAAHTHAWADITGEPTTLAGYGITDAASDAELAAHAADTTSVHGIADTAALVLTGDSRLSDARTPTAHAASHQNGGSDEIATVTPGALLIPKATAGGQIDRAWVPDASTTAKGIVELATSGESAANVVVQGNDSRLSDARTPTAHAASHQPGGADAMAVNAAAGTGSLRSLGTGSTQAAAGNHTHTFAAITSKPTTLAGYGITDAASDAELASHEADTTNVHGIVDTSALVLTTDARLDIVEDYDVLVPFGTLGLSTFTVTSGRAYWVYMGRVKKAFTAAFVRFAQNVAGSGAQTAEVGIFSTATPPRGAGLSFTKIAANGTLDSLTSTGNKKNTISMAQAVAAGTYLWVGLRFAMATTQPTVLSTTFDLATAYHQIADGGGALTGAGPWSGSFPGFTTGGQVPWVNLTAY